MANGTLLEPAPSGTSILCFLLIVVLILFIILVSTERTGSLFPALIPTASHFPVIMRPRTIQHSDGRYLAVGMTTGSNVRLLMLQASPFIFDCDMKNRLSVMISDTRLYVSVNQPPARKNTYLALGNDINQALVILPTVTSPLRVLDHTGALFYITVHETRLLLWTESADLFVG